MPPPSIPPGPVAPGTAVPRGLVAAAALAGAAVLTTTVLDPRGGDPWPAVLLGWFAASSLLAWALRPVPVRVLLVNAAVVFLVLAGFERWLLLSTGGVPEWGKLEGRSTTGSFFRPDALRGYAPARSATAVSRLEQDGFVSYEVTSTIGPDGFRLTPRPVVDPPEGTTLVFGCSFAYGEGLDDAGTLPWRLSEESGRRRLVRNLGFLGYGPHQMLALLESGRALAGVRVAQPVTAVYEALGDHAARALGRRPWSRGTPRYLPGPSGTVERRGVFGELDPVLESWITFRKVLGSERRVSSSELARVVAIVLRSRALLREAAPGARFEVLYWDEPDDLSRSYRAALLEAGLAVHDVSRILPGYPDERKGWQIPRDGHPTAAANARLARALAGR